MVRPLARPLAEPLLRQHNLATADCPYGHHIGSARAQARAVKPVVAAAVVVEVAAAAAAAAANYAFL